TYRGTLYLLTMSELHPFCLAARGDAEFPYGILRRKWPASISSKLMAYNHLNIADEFQILIDLPPIKFRVIKANKISRRRCSDTEEEVSQKVTVNAGSQDHLFVGMEFSPKDTDRSSPILTIKSVQQHQATAWWRYYVEPGGELAAVEVVTRMKHTLKIP
ncbi:MAG: hypothetical protein AAGA30_18520, partial [Planctomycetota bacterium]